MRAKELNRYLTGVTKAKPTQLRGVLRKAGVQLALEGFPREAVALFDLATGEVRPAVDVGCPGRDVRGIFPGPKGVGALVIGQCNAPRTRTQMLWILGS